jgi:hypothetical protein
MLRTTPAVTVSRKFLLEVGCHSKKSLNTIFLTFMITGLVDAIQCSLPNCTSSQIPSIDNCIPSDGYQRKVIYRSWNTSCSPLLVDLSVNNVYPWSYSGSWNYGSYAIVRCADGFNIPQNYPSVILPSSFQIVNYKCLKPMLPKGLQCEPHYGYPNDIV